MNRSAGGMLLHYGERVDAEVISPDKTRICRILPKRAAVGVGWRAPRSAICWTSVSRGGVELHFDVEKV